MAHTNLCIVIIIIINRWWFQATSRLECRRKNGPEGILHRDAPHKEGITRLRNSAGSSVKPCSRPCCWCLCTTCDGHFCKQFCSSCGAGTGGHLRNITDAWTWRRLITCRLYFQCCFYCLTRVFLHNFLYQVICSFMYPENPEGTRVIVAINFFLSLFFWCSCNAMFAWKYYA